MMIAAALEEINNFKIVVVLVGSCGSYAFLERCYVNDLVILNFVMY
jgi:tRNA A37 threonylcarbamoyladenosine dehydratase